MKAALFYYDGFAQFEIALALLKLDALEWHHIALEKRPYKSLEGQTFLVQGTLEIIDPNTIDLMVIPGGDSLPLFHVEALKTFIEACLSSGGIVAVFVAVQNYWLDLASSMVYAVQAGRQVSALMTPLPSTIPPQSMKTSRSLSMIIKRVSS